MMGILRRLVEKGRIVLRRGEPTLPPVSAATASEGPPPDRIAIIEAVMRALEAVPWVTTLWMNGAVSNRRLDRWSDIDLNVAAEDERAWQVFPIVEAALERLAPIELRHRSLAPPDGSYQQRFYRLKGTSHFQFVDLAVFRHSEPQKYLEPVEFGTPHVLLDRTLGAAIPRFDAGAFAERLRRRLEHLRAQHQMFGRLVEKELARGHLIEAQARFQQYLFMPLVEALRIHYRPEHYQYGVEDLDFDLPAPVVNRLVEYSFVRDGDDLAVKARKVDAWLTEVLARLESGVTSLPSSPRGDVGE